MKCDVCGSSSKAEARDGRLMCTDCGMPKVPETTGELRRCRDEYRALLSSHRRGGWGDQPDVLVGYCERISKELRAEYLECV